MHALQALAAGLPVMLRYGRGSPFADIQLLCGGGLDILLLPRPDITALAGVAVNRQARWPCTLGIDLQSGAMAISDTGATG